MNRYALFLGCTTPTQVIQYEISSRWVCRALGIELIDVADFTCCGMNQGNLSLEAEFLLAAMNLAHAEAKGLDILALCPACAGTLAEAIERLRDQGTRDRVNASLARVGLEYKGGARVKHLSRVLYEDVGLERIRGSVQRDLSALRLAPHYGCHYLKPKSAFEGFEDPDNPRTLGELISAAGAHPAPYATLPLCCGGKSFPVSREPAIYLVRKKLDDLIGQKVDGLIVHCQTCYLMYSDQQKAVRERFGGRPPMPVLLYPQLLGLAMGGDPVNDLGLDLHAVPLDGLLAKAGIDKWI
jgi:heterodisulfide reductase subunit B